MSSAPERTEPGRSAVRLPSRPWPGSVLLEASRPRQWPKNLLVLAAPLAGGALTHAGTVAGALFAVGCFACAASGGYLINDVVDAPRDRLHVLKRHRPVASGRLPVTVAVSFGALLLLLAASAPLLTPEPGLGLVIGLYAVTTVSYGVRLKQIPDLELLVLAAGFVLRPIAGAVATDVPPSRAFLLVCCLGALMVVAGKRYAELNLYGDRAADQRQVLGHYRPATMRRIRNAAAAAMLLTYTWWALRHAGVGAASFYTLSVLPLGGVVARFLRANDAAAGEAPEELLLRDRRLQILALGWGILFLCGVAAHG